MASLGDIDLSPVPNYDPGSDKVEMILEGHLMKQNRSRHSWKRRYFVFCSNQQLSCFHRQADSVAKSTFKITRESGCQISDMFVQKASKSSSKAQFYCFTIAWPEDAGSATTLADTNNTKALHESHALRDDMSQESFPESPINRRRGIERAHSNPSLLSPKRSSDALDDTPKTPSRASSPFVPKKRKNKADSSDSVSSSHHRKHSFTNMFRRNRSYDEENGSDDSVDDQRNIARTPGSTSQVKRRTLDQNGGEVPSIVNMNLIEPPPLVTVDPPKGHRRTNSDPPFRSFPPNPHHQEEKSELDRSDHTRLRMAASAGAEDGNMPESMSQQDPEKSHLLTQYRSNKKEKSKKSRQKMIDGTKYVAAAGAAVGITFLTSGIGLVAGAALLGVTAAAGGTAVGAEERLKRKKSTTKLTLASSNFEQAKAWKSTLDSCLAHEFAKESTWAQMFIAEGGKTATAFFPHERRDTTKSRNTDTHKSLEERRTAKQFILRKHDGDIPVECSSEWVPLEGGWTSLLGSGSQGLRIFREERIGNAASHNIAPSNSSGCATMKAQLVVNAQPLDAFMCLMSVNRMKDEIRVLSGQRSSFRVLEKIDDHTDIVHVVCRELYLFPSTTSPRDFVLFRYWRFEPDGSYIVCFESTEHALCPPRLGFIRGDLHQVLTIAPKRKTRQSHGDAAECLITSVVQVDPKGWIRWIPIPPLFLLSRQGYGDAFGVSALLNLLDIRDAITADRFLNVSPDMYEQAQPTKFQPPHSGHHMPHLSEEVGAASASAGMGMPRPESANYDLRYANRERLESENLHNEGIEKYPEPLPSDKWAEPDANTFLVRGPNYMKDKVKVNAGASIGRLLAVDIITVDKPILSGVSKHPSERIQLALERERKLLAKGLKSDMPPFIFVVNIVLPGPPFYHGVFYYAVDDMSAIDGSDGTGSSALCSKFLFGESDEFRDRTFKLIPQIVRGNFMVRKAVGSTPAIMGTKLKQTYVLDKRFMEVVLDCGSSAVATGVIRLCLGYAKTLMVDMAFLLEANEPECLPERVFGCVRVKYPEFSSELRKVEEP